MWKMILKYDRTYIPYKNTFIILTTHFLENLEKRFPDIKLKRIENAIKRKLSKNQIPMNKRVFIKLVRQEFEDDKKPRLLPSAFLVVERKKRNDKKFTTETTVITIRPMHFNQQQKRKDEILHEN